MAITITSTAFEEGRGIPTEYTCDGANISPPLIWTGVPNETNSLALLMNDPDAPSGTFTHWILFDIPRDTAGLSAYVPADELLENGAQQATNSFGNIGYGGPCPPKGHGPHRYFFRLFALDSDLDINRGASGDDLINAMKGHILDEGYLMGRYERGAEKARDART